MPCRALTRHTQTPARARTRAYCGTAVQVELYSAALEGSYSDYSVADSDQLVTAVAMDAAAAVLVTGHVGGTVRVHGRASGSAAMTPAASASNAASAAQGARPAAPLVMRISARAITAISCTALDEARHPGGELLLFVGDELGNVTAVHCRREPQEARASSAFAMTTRTTSGRSMGPPSNSTAVQAVLFKQGLLLIATAAGELYCVKCRFVAQQQGADANGRDVMWSPAAGNGNASGGSSSGGAGRASPQPERQGFARVSELPVRKGGIGLTTTTTDSTSFAAYGSCNALYALGWGAAPPPPPTPPVAPSEDTPEYDSDAYGQQGGGYSQQQQQPGAPPSQQQQQASRWRLLSAHSGGQLLLWDLSGGRLQPVCVMGSPGPSVMWVMWRRALAPESMRVVVYVFWASALCVGGGGVVCGWRWVGL